MTGGSSRAATIAESLTVGGVAHALPTLRPGSIDALTEVGAGAITLGLDGTAQAQAGQGSAAQAGSQAPQRFAPREAGGQIFGEGVKVESGRSGRRVPPLIGRQLENEASVPAAPLGGAGPDRGPGTTFSSFFPFLARGPLRGIPVVGPAWRALAPAATPAAHPLFPRCRQAA